MLQIRHSPLDFSHRNLHRVGLNLGNLGTSFESRSCDHLHDWASTITQDQVVNVLTLNIYLNLELFSDDREIDLIISNYRPASKRPWPAAGGAGTVCVQTSSPSTNSR